MGQAHSAEWLMRQGELAEAVVLRDRATDTLREEHHGLVADALGGTDGDLRARGVADPGLARRLFVGPDAERLWCLVSAPNRRQPPLESVPQTLRSGGRR